MEPSVSLLPVHRELLLQELAGKVRATGEYDSIIWKIRTGYLAVLYGVLGLIIGTDGVPEARAIAGDITLSATVLLTLIGFSGSGFLIDTAYTHSKLRVVVARDALMRRYVRLTGPSPIEEFGRLLNLTGEDPGLFEVSSSSRSNRGTEMGEPLRGSEDDALCLELAEEYRRRSNAQSGVLGSLYLIAPAIAVLIWVVAFVG